MVYKVMYQLEKGVRWHQVNLLLERKKRAFAVDQGTGNFTPIKRNMLVDSKSVRLKYASGCRYGRLKQSGMKQCNPNQR